MYQQTGIYPVVIENEPFEHIADTLFERKLNHFASELFGMGFSDSYKIEESIFRAIKVCNAAHIPVRENFKAIYVCSENEILRDWRLSNFALMLVVINADAGNPVVARTQVQLINARSHETR